LTLSVPLSQFTPRVGGGSAFFVGREMNQLQFSQLTEAEEQWKEAQLLAAREIVSRLCPDDAWNPIRLEALNRAWSIWIAAGEKHNQKINEHINAFGIAFGQLLVDSGIFCWVIVSDDYGTDLGIRALPKRGDVSVVPADFVAKRWERKEVDFFVDGYSDILAHVEKLKTEWDNSGK
jgi:hypothetical protein